MFWVLIETVRLSTHNICFGGDKNFLGDISRSVSMFLISHFLISYCMTASFTRFRVHIFILVMSFLHIHAHAALSLSLLNYS